VPEIVTAALTVLCRFPEATPTAVEAAPQGALMLAFVVAQWELEALDAPCPTLPASCCDRALTAEALRSAVVELGARGWCGDE